MTIPNVKKTASSGEDDVPEATERVPYVTGPRNFLDNERIAARQAHYGNSATEAAMVAATDEAAFDRVRKIEQVVIAQAESAVRNHRALNDDADDLADRIFKLSADVQTGKVDPNVAAVEFEQLRGRADVLRSKIARARRELDTHTAKVRDPYGHAQTLLERMPHHLVQPLS